MTNMRALLPKATPDLQTSDARGTILSTTVAHYASSPVGPKRTPRYFARASITIPSASGKSARNLACATAGSSQPSQTMTD